jgi:hypothetical protein
MKKINIYIFHLFIMFYLKYFQHQIIVDKI